MKTTIKTGVRQASNYADLIQSHPSSKVITSGYMSPTHCPVTYEYTVP